MKKNSKVYIAAAVCIGIGIVLTAGGIMAGGRPGVSVGSDGIRMLGDRNREDYVLEKTKLDDFSSVEMNLDYGDFHLIPSDGYYLEYCLSGNSQKPKYEVNNGTFIFSEKPVVSYVQFQIMSFDFHEFLGQYYVNLYVPEDIYFENFVLNNDSGNAGIETLEGKSIDIQLSYGDLSADTIGGETVKIDLASGNLEAGQVTGRQKLDISLDYGDLEAESLNAAGSGEMDLGSGNLTLDSCIAGDMSMNLDYGDLKIQVMKGSSLMLDNSSGNVTIGELTLEDKGIFTLDYGDAKVGIGDDLTGYTMNLNTDYGEISVPESGKLTKEEEEQSCRLEGTGDKKLEIDCSSGDITVTGLKN